LVKGGSGYWYIRMRILKGGDAFKGCDQTDKDKAVTVFFFIRLAAMVAEPPVASIG
tara:strand:- start:668 stop:835 length:168 start_codon:yes stop_codon:yes gene_type:complete